MRQPISGFALRGRIRREFLYSIFLVVGVASILAARLVSSAQPNSVMRRMAQHLTAQQRMMRDDFLNLRRTTHRIPPLARTFAVHQMRSLPMGAGPGGATWQFIGPQPVTNGQGLAFGGFCSPPVRIDASGRATAIKTSP